MGGGLTSGRRLSQSRHRHGSVVWPHHAPGVAASRAVWLLHADLVSVDHCGIEPRAHLGLDPETKG